MAVQDLIYHVELEKGAYMKDAADLARTQFIYDATLDPLREFIIWSQHGNLMTAVQLSGRAARLHAEFNFQY